MKVNRAYLSSQAFAERIAKAERLGLIAIRPVEERERTRDEVLRAFAGEDLWIFGYGSLMWNPAIDVVEARPARVYGYHRHFCLATRLGRGTPDNPGLVLGLLPGGSCNGVAFRIAADKAAHELDVVWKREMVGYGYFSRIVPIRTPQGPERAVTFVVNRAADNFTGRLALDRKTETLATAAGEIGAAHEYLFSAEKILGQYGLTCRYIEELSARVRARLDGGPMDAREGGESIDD